MEVGEEGDYIPITILTVTTRMTPPALGGQR